MTIRSLAGLGALLLASAALAGPGYSVELREVGANKISVIKVVREITGLGLKETKDLVEAAPKVVKAGLDQTTANALAARIHATGATVVVLGPDSKVVTAAPPPPAPAAGGSSTVTLVAIGPSKIQVIKIVREATGLGLKAAKDLVEKAPVTVKTGLAAAEAEALVNLLQFAGGTAKVSAAAP